MEVFGNFNHWVKVANADKMDEKQPKYIYEQLGLEELKDVNERITAGDYRKYAPLAED